ncbi:MAG: dimethyl sulfoxide reductase anchor subunit [Rhodospirillales bacterium]|nr:dimethyl sulfoxide reductase anchor subunit [Rhodospirillales bacterium]
MHPALSVIVFSTASGAGYGLLALLGILAPLDVVPEDRAFGFIALALALAAITGGLLASLLHLGHRERAWRALSQWRSSWLSREGVAAIATYLPAGAFGILWIFFGKVSAIAGAVATLCAVVTVCCTAMIYRSLKPIPRWHNGWVLPNYLLAALMSGALCLALVVQLFGPKRGVSALAVAAVAMAAFAKLGYWRSIDGEAATSTSGSATGLGHLGEVRLFEAPHTSQNYLLKEMGFEIARKHSIKLRRIALVAGYGLAFLLSIVPLLASGWPAAVAALLAALLGMSGIFVERWLFFAEARHAVTLYYGRSAV